MGNIEEAIRETEMNETGVVSGQASATTSHLKSVGYAETMPASSTETQGPVRPDWLKVGVVAAASVVLGGLAAAWFYRKTLSRLREAESEIPDFRIIEDGSAEDF